MTPAHRAVPVRRRAAAALAAVAVGGVAVLLSLGSGASAAPAGRPVFLAAAAPVTTTAGKLTLTVDPAGGLTSAGATLKVTGSGFDTGTGIYVAICHADGKAPASLRDCVGGAIPNSNPTSSWAHVSGSAAPPANGSTTGSTNGPANGPVQAKWGTGGTFAVALTLPPSNSASDALDCAQVPCAVFTAPDAGTSTRQNLSIPLVYSAPVTSGSASPSSTPPSSTPSSVSSSASPQDSTSAAVPPTTVQAKIVRSPKVVAGGAQEVLFAGFAKNEPVTVTLYSAPRSLPAVRADGDGIVKVDFTVPADLPAGTHLLQVVGQVSRVTGVASFVVSAPVVASSAAVVPSTPTTSSASYSAPASSAVPVPAPLSSALSSVASSAPASSSATPVAPGAPARAIVWPWYALGALLVLLAGLVTYLLIRRSRLAAEQREKDAILAEAAVAEQQRAAELVARANPELPTAYLAPPPSGPPPMPPPGGGYLGYHPGEHGLLAGRDNPDRPGMLSGGGSRQDPAADGPTSLLPGAPAQHPEDRTTQLSDDRTRQLPGGGVAGDPPPGGGVAGGDAPTGTWRPDFDADVERSGAPAEDAGNPDPGHPDAGHPDAGHPGDENPGDENPKDGNPGAGGRHSRPT